ncbi:MAG TPA: hypothetical protein VMB91_07190 [Solirubrobacteraceae bacterium]|nr:hypothetical protein [Solirubrobacteraceae bacterium]
MTEIRSYRRVFDLERRVYSVDRLRLNPSGVPVRGVAYFLALVAGLLVASSLPLLGAVLGLAPWYLRDLLLPALAAAVMALIRVEGRTFHHAASSLARFACARRRLAGGSRRCGPERWHPHDVLVLPDGSEARFRELRYTGPGAVLLTRAHVRNDRRAGSTSRAWLPGDPRAALTVRDGPPAGSFRPQVILLAAGARLRVRGDRGGPD